MSNNEVVEIEQRSLVRSMAKRFGVMPDRLLRTLRETAFKEEVTNEQMMALLVVADQYGLNPFTKELYAFPDKEGIVPVVGVDGWARIINQHPMMNGIEFDYSNEIVHSENGEHKDVPAWCECRIYRKDREHPVVVREYFDEVYRKPIVKHNRAIAGPWQTHTKRMLRHKAMIQAARVAFGFVGIYDPDEADRIRQRDTVIDVTPEADHNEGQGEPAVDRLKQALQGPSIDSLTVIDESEGETATDDDTGDDDVELPDLENE